ncbi:MULTISPECIES: bifunctional phosphopantothenoylcysteine decarboxylase/phosphopantothenate--cysteine ligase CoaBC [unclassified Rhodococcus (in: high G+C Gram-positive bacteria)]|uniref:bifunctional phosphopantothenoylcysteine decarboxylase/phosphopantothenate--cysteine ligase CoaBC n=1 Tax=unclassified Rhodococcus (in: high G+C Gram-positive bacteria) TaxID=192944 RepID=UPI00146E5D5A|nr:bifunctional phosphopantothenoylcysteine decarboxylase/phosphopantothenate--cysteine ligase CoaBC [Rhodococcus sp. (in: high G+C Gram-positive bacteria)]MBF0662555.1 bifunctional phosphopantothenoylcysteine decarboxylase/phosphopantothenate--cysteine ligase CoaBC [Rhodococcus sp. (in: high G+C Gram-positive bacteria)]NMD96529.1 bifunctional phosphopantothenoylcysteine decarboxylase/phosphopantothenate--cysteine ligase CoaBC [Rhodococcus sp. BL-253-APC-6A1W]NME79332.1 bifunctional phosphopanto
MSLHAADGAPETGQRRRVVVGVAGGIAAYKACALIRAFTENGHHVRVVPTESALQFVGRATFEALSGNPVHTGVFADVPEVPHVRLGQEADLVVVAPATADLMARAVSGRADDLLTATLLTARCPVMFVPAMHTEMWEHPATVDNVATLRRRGSVVVEPASGRLTGKDTGAGRLPEPDEIYALAALMLERADALPRDLVGRRIVVSAGGTREPLDPVRFLGNRSSGKQGYALARLAAQRGADVTLVAGAVAGLDDPAAVDVVRVQTAAQMQDAVTKHAATADAVIMSAAVADFRPAAFAESKIKKGAGEPDSIALTKNDDILAGLVRSRADGGLSKDTVIVGFAAETGDEHGDVLTYAREKLARKGCDLLVVNAVGDGKAFEVDHNDGWLLSADGSETALAHGSKALMASRVLDALRPLLAQVERT